MNYSSALSLAIRARAIADTTLVGSGGYVATTGLRRTFAGQDAAFPYIIYHFSDVSNDEAFRTETYIQRVDWHVFVPEEPQAVAPDPFLLADNIVTRLMGDWSAQTYGTGPTYGFNRWQPTVSGWSPNPFEHTGTTNQDEPGVLHRIVQFQIRMNKAGA